MNEDVSKLTLDEMKLQLNIQSTLIYAADREIDHAAGDYEARIASADSDNIRAAYEEEYLPSLRQVEAETEAVAAKADTIARAIFRVTGKAFPSLQDNEFPAVASRRELIKEQAESRRIPEVLDRVREAVLTQDRVGMFLWQNYVPTRLRADGESSQYAVERQELRSLISQIETTLANPVFEPVNAKARELISAAGDLQRKASKRRRAEYVQSKPFSFQNSDDVAWKKPAR